MTGSEAADASTGSKVEPPRHRTIRWRMLLTILLGASVVIVAAGGVDYAVLSHRLQRVSVDLPAQGNDTWLIVGSDSRSAIPDGKSDDFGAVTEVPGQRADIVIVVRNENGHRTVTSIPRDTLVSPSRGKIDRLALTLLRGPQTLVDSVNRTLHIAVGHLVIFTMKAFADVVDALGGLDIDQPVPVRDKKTGLALPSGRSHLSGAQTLALVRSRHPEFYKGSTWSGVTLKDGAAYRADNATDVFERVQKKLGDALIAPWALQRVAWVASSGMTLDQDTSLCDLASLR